TTDKAMLTSKRTGRLISLTSLRRPDYITRESRTLRRTSLPVEPAPDSSCRAEGRASGRSLSKTSFPLAPVHGKRGIPPTWLLEIVVWRRSSNRTSRRLDFECRISGTQRSEIVPCQTLGRAAQRPRLPSSGRIRFPNRGPFPVRRLRLLALLHPESTARL